MLLAIAVYLPHIVHGGWYLDDWIHVALMSEAGGPLDVLNTMNGQSYRPGLALSLSLFYAIGGEGQAGYLTIGAVLAAAQGWLFYLVLRALRLGAAVAAVGAAIFVVLPIIDATRLWMAAFPIQVAGTLYLLGVLTALHGVGAHGRRAVSWHAGATVLYFASVLTYEVVAGLIAVTPLLYMVRSGWRPAIRRWLPDLASIALALAIIAPRGAADRDAETSLGFIWDRAIQTVTEGEEVFRWLLPWPEVLGGPIGLVLLLAGMLGAGIAIGRHDEAGAGLAAWAKIAALGAVFALAGLVMLLPADPYFVPRISGLGNRTSAFAAFGAVLLLIALIVLAMGGLGTLLRRPRLGFMLATALVLVTGLNLTHRELRQQDPWADSWQQQKDVVSAVDAALQSGLPAGAGIVSFGHTTFILPADVSVFAYSWDLRGALWETYDRPDIAARPWVAGATCGASGVVFPDGSTTRAGSEPFGYGKVFFVDVATRTAARIGDRVECDTEVAALTDQPAA